MPNERVITLKFKGDDKDVLASISRLEAASKRLNNSFSNAGGRTTTTTSRASGIDAEYRRAQAEIKRFQQSSIQMERELTRHVEREAKAQATAKINEARRANVAAIRELKQLESETAKSSKNSQSVFSSALGGSFFGNLGANAVSFFIGKISQLPSLISDVIGKATELSENKLNSLKGLSSAALFKGFDTNEAENVAKNLRLVKAGIVGLTDAASGEKSLLQFGFNVEQARNLLEAFSDSAAFGKQSALTYGEAVSRTAEGVKQFNSGLADAGGMTTNLSIIMERAGLKQEDFTNKQTAAAATTKYYNALMEELAGVTGNADKLTVGYTGSVAGLDQAYKNLYAAGGDLITQSPEIVAANKIQAEQVRGLTNDLLNQGNQTSETAQDWIKMSAKITAGLYPFASIVKNVFGGVFAAASGLAAGAMGVVAGVLETVANGIRFTLGSIYNLVVDNINNAIALSKKLPLGLGGGLQFVNPIETRANTDFNYDYTEKFFGGFKAAMNDAVEYTKKAGLSINEFGDTMTLLNKKTAEIKTDQVQKKEFERLRQEQIKAFRANPDGTIGKQPNATGGANSASGKKSKKDLFAEIENIGNQLGFTATSKYRAGGPNGATDHAGKGAVDFGVNTNNKKTLDEWTRLIIAGLQNNKQVIDERIVGAHPGIKGGKNVHLGNSNNRSLFLDQSQYTVPVEYLKQLDAKRRSRKGLDIDTSDITKDFNDNIRRALEDKSNNLTKAARDKNIALAIQLYKSAGLIPTGEILEKFQDYMAEEAKKSGAIQKTSADIANEFKVNALGKRGEIPTIDRTVNGEITKRQTSDEKYIANLRISLGLTKETADEQTRAQQIFIREQVMMEEVSALLEDQSNSRREATLEAEIEYQLLLRRNTAEEISLRFAQSRNDQLKELGDTEQTIELLRQQNADARFVDQRRFLGLKREQLSLEQTITDLQDQITGGGVNTALEIQAAHLRDILDLRNRETDAIIASNRAELELSQSMEISSNQIRARVLEHLASQKTLNESIADGIINIYDKAANKIDSLLDKSIGKIPILGDVAKTFARNALTNVTRGLLDKFLPGLGDSLAKTGNPALDAANKSARHLESIDKKLGGSLGGGFSIPGISGGASSGGGGLFGSIFGGNAGGGIFNFGGGSGGSSSGTTNPGGIFDSIGKLFGFGGGGRNGTKIGVGGSTTGGSGGILGSLGGLFGAGGISNAMATGGLSLAASVFIASLKTTSKLKGALGGGLIGFVASILNLNSRRKKEEQLRSQYLNEAVAGLSAFDSLIADVRGLRVDPGSAIAQGTSIGQTLRENYLTQAGALKDKKTRDIALRSVSELDFRIATKMAELRGVADIATSANERKNRILPEFQSGGLVSDAFRQRSLRQFQGLVPGIYDRRDDKMIAVSGNEVVLTPNHWRPIAPYLQQMRVPGFADGGLVTPTFAPNFTAPQSGDIHVHITVAGEIDAARITDVAIEGLGTERGQRKVVTTIEKARDANVFKPKQPNRNF